MQLRVSPKWFEREVATYSDPYASFWREILQNSLDAGASRIDIRVGDNDDPPFGSSIQRVIVADNGCGMTEDQIDNVFLSLGETDKKHDSIGGYARARVLICFAQKWYQIESGYTVVQGCGSYIYPRKHRKNYYQGLKLTVDVNTELGGQRVNLLSKLQSYLKFCDFKTITVFVNGKVWNDYTVEASHGRQLSFGRLTYNESGNGLLLVRVKGVLMFARATHAKALVIIELDSQTSRQILTANRDGFTAAYRAELDTYLSDISSDVHTALRPVTNRITRIAGQGVFTVNGENRYAALTTMTTPRKHASREYIEVPDVLVYDDTSNPQVRRVIEKYNPLAWGKQEGVLQGGDRAKLLLQWQSVCEYVIARYVDWCPSAFDGVTKWGVGWIFSDTNNAVHHISNDVHYLCLNPVDEHGNMKWKLRSSADRMKMLVIAAHEISHISHQRHDESFAGTMTYNMIHALTGDFKNIFKPKIHLHKTGTISPTVRVA